MNYTLSNVYPSETTFYVVAYISGVRKVELVDIPAFSKLEDAKAYVQEYAAEYSEHTLIIFESKLGKIKGTGKYIYDYT